MRARHQLAGRRGWLKGGRRSAWGTWPGWSVGARLLTRDVPRHVHAHGDSEAKTQIDSEVAPHFTS